MLHFAVFHLGLHYLPKYPLGISSIQRVKGPVRIVSENVVSSSCPLDLFAHIID